MTFKIYCWLNYLRHVALTEPLIRWSLSRPLLVISLQVKSVYEVRAKTRDEDVELL